MAEGPLYTIQNHAHDFFTGVCADGRQVVMGLLCPKLVAYFFDRLGRHIDTQSQLWEYPAPRMEPMPPELAHIPTILPPGLGPYRIHDDKFQAALSAQLDRWQRSMSSKPGPIRIQPFFDHAASVGITLCPDELSKRERAKWAATGRFVWWWCKDYWVDPSESA